MTQAFVDVLVKETLKQIKGKKADGEALRLRKALANANKSGLLKRLMV